MLPPTAYGGMRIPYIVRIVSAYEAPCSCIHADCGGSPYNERPMKRNIDSDSEDSQPSNVQNAKIMSHDILINEHGMRWGLPQPRQHKRMIAVRHDDDVAKVPNPRQRFFSNTPCTRFMHACRWRITTTVQQFEHFASSCSLEQVCPRHKFHCKNNNHLTILGEGPATPDNVISKNKQPPFNSGNNSLQTQ